MKSRLILLLFFLPIYIYGQWIPERLTTNPALAPQDSNRLTIEADVLGFFKNNEYFSPIAKGKTIPGVRFEPKVGYQLGKQFKAELGVLGIYYSGDQQKDGMVFFNQVTARLQYDVTPEFHVLLGNYYGGVNHRLLEPLYNWDQHLDGKPESGIQLIYKNEKYFADAWVNWERYIEYGDSVPEILTFGVSASMELTSPKNRLRFWIPFQLTIHHIGGQIDTSSEKMVVAGNAATGIRSEYAIEGSFIKSVGASLYALGYYDKLENLDLRPYNNGWGLYPMVQLKAKRWEAMVGYWHARRFYSFLGNPLFASFNTYYPDELLTRRQLLTTKFSYSKRVNKAFSWGAHAETYTDLKRGRTDYSFGLYMRFTGQFLK